MTANGLDPRDHTPRTTEQGCSVRELMLSAGLELLERDGLGFGPDTIGYARVFRYLEDNYAIRVTRGSVHERIWASHADFRREVMTTALISTPKDPLALPPLDLSELFAAANVKTAEDRIAAFARSRGAEISAAVLSSSGAGRTQALMAACCRLNDPDGSAAFRTAFGERIEAVLEDLVVGWPFLLARLGLQPKPEHRLSVEQCAVICTVLSYAAARGAYLNHSAGCADFSEPLPATSARPQDAWLPLSLITKALLDFLFEDGAAPIVAEGAPRLLSKTSGSELVDLNDEGSPRRSRQKLRELVVAAGVEVLLNDAVILRPESLRYSEVLAHIKETHAVTVHRSSVHGRLWETQDDFQLEVLARSVTAGNQFGDHVAAQYDQDRSLTHVVEGSVERRRALTESVRRMARSQADGLLVADNYQRELLIKASLADRPESDRLAEIKSAIRAGDLRKLGRYQQITTNRLLSLGFAARPELAATDEEVGHTFARLVSTITTGSVFDELAGARSISRTFEVARGDGSGAKDEWPIIAIAVMALFDHFFVEI